MSLPHQLSEIPLLEGWDFTATGQEMAPLLQCVPLSGFVSGCEGSGLSARPSHTSLLKLAVSVRWPRTWVQCALAHGTPARPPDILSLGVLIVLRSVARENYGRILCPEFMSICCKQGTCPMFWVSPLQCIWAQQSSYSCSASSIPSCVKPSLPVLLPFWSKDYPSSPSLNKHHTTEPRDRSLAFHLFVSYTSEICLRPGIPGTNVFILHLETFK